MGQWAKGIEAITLFVENVDVAREFYVRVFEMPIIYEDSNGVVFNFGSSWVNLLKKSEANELVEPALVGDKESGSRLVFTISVEDVDSTCADLAERGVTLLNGPMDRPWGRRTASFADPDGYIWEVAK